MEGSGTGEGEKTMESKKPPPLGWAKPVIVNAAAWPANEDTSAP